MIYTAFVFWSLLNYYIRVSIKPHRPICDAAPGLFPLFKIGNSKERMMAMLYHPYNRQFVLISRRVLTSGILFLFSMIFFAASQSLFAQGSKGGIIPLESASDVRINEIMASNNTTYQDEDGEYSDWVEIHNAGATNIDLDGWYLSDDSTNLKKWQFPPTVLLPGDYLVVFASDKNRTNPYLHTNFKITADGEFLALTQPDTTMIASEYRPKFPPQAPDVSLGVFGSSQAYYSTPTPAAANVAGTVDLVISNDRVDEHSPNDTYIGTFITTDIDTNTATAYSLLDNAGGRFKLVGKELQIANSTLLDFDTNPSHQITVRSTYGGGTVLDKVLTIYVNKVYYSDVVINEFLASNSTDLQDEDGDYSDWLEIHNTGTLAVNLENWYLTDSDSNKIKWQFPSVILPAGGYLVVFASGKDLVGGELHTNFKLGAEGEYLGLVQPNGDIVVSEYDQFPPQATDVSYGKLSGSEAYFSTPTPGAANSTGTVDFVISDNSVNEHSPNDTYIGTFITTNITTGTATYSLLNDAGGRFKIVGNELQVANSNLLDFDTDPSHQITARTTYGGGTTLDENFIINVNKVYPMDLQISEFMASNSSTLQDEDGDYSDWIEIHNFGTTAINLENWFITDNGGNLDKWQFPSRNLPAGGYLVIFASDKNRTGSQLHTNFKLGAEGEYLGLVQPNGEIIVSEYAPQFPQQYQNISYGLYNGTKQYFAAPTPGSSNTAGILPIEPLTVTPERGFYNSAFNVTISTTTPGTQIRYTLDGSKPTLSNGSTYGGPISITKTTVLRAAAYRTGYLPSPVETHTYLFLEEVIEQPYNIPGYPIHSYSLGGSAEVPHDHEMDPEIVDDPAYSGSIIKGLTDIPTMVIVVDPDSLYGNTFYDDDDLEQKVSMELLDYHNPNKNDQIDCGIEGHSHIRLKRSLRLSFKAEYGSSSWNTTLFKDAPLSGESAAEDQKRIVLRGGNNRCWARKWNPDKTTYTEDQWFRDTQIAMSGYGSHGNFVHLYINGIYWGLYNPVERPDHFFSATYFGGGDEDWYAFNHDGAISGDDSRYTYLIEDMVNKDMTNPANYAEMQEYLDLDGFIDYVMLAWYGGVSDWPDNNYWGSNHNIPAGPTRYYLWDAEWSWNVSQDFGDDVYGAWVHPDFAAGENGGEPISDIWAALDDNEDFLMRFADRIYLHCFNGGVLTDSSSLARWDTLNQYVRDAIIAESAKWGDCQEPVGKPLRTRDEDWQDEVDAIAAIMDANVARFLVALRNEGYYPAINPPNFSQRGGSVPAGFSVSLSNPNGSGTIYYTTDGSDPRASGGGISGSAQVYSSEIVLNDMTTIKTRVRNGSVWSALNQALFLVSPDLTVHLKLKVFLEGPYNPAANEMTTTLNAAGDLPLTSPYAADQRTLFAMPANISDWVLVELRNTASGTALSSYSALLRKDGLIVGDNGTTEHIVVAAEGDGDYFIVIKHRNHLPIMSAAAVSLSKTPSLYNFTTAQAQAYGTNPLTLLESGVYGMPAGDANGNGVVNTQDRETVWRSHNGTPWSYAKNSDLNLDGGIDAEDLNQYWRPNAGKITQVPGAQTAKLAMQNQEPLLSPGKAVSKTEVKTAKNPAAGKPVRQSNTGRR